MMLLNDDRRDSPRVLTRLFVRGLGADRAWTDRLGDLGLGGVGFELPHVPEAERYQVRFTCPGEEKLRTATAEVVSADPMPGTLDREGPFFVHLRFIGIDDPDEFAIARSLDRLAYLAEQPIAPEGATVLQMANQAHQRMDFDVDEEFHSMLPLDYYPDEPAETILDDSEDEPLPAWSSLPQHVEAGEGGLGRYMFGYLGHDYRSRAVGD